MKVKDDDLESLDSGTLFGLGLRLIKGTEQVYLHTNDVTENTLLKLAREAASALGKGKRRLTPQPFKGVEASGSSGKSTPRQDKLNLLKDISKRLRNVDSKIFQATPLLAESHQYVHILNSEGLNKTEERSYARVNMVCLAQKGTATEMGYTGVGRTLDFNYLKDFDLGKYIE